MDRILRSAPAVVGATFVDQYGEPSAPVGAVTVGITRADGTVLVADGTPTDTGSDGQPTYSLTVADTALLDLLTATWSDAGNDATIETQIAVVGGFYVNLAEMRNFHRDLSSAVSVPDTKLFETRRIAENECELCSGVSFVPQYTRVQLDGDGTTQLYAGVTALRSVRSVRVYEPGLATYTSFTDAELAALDLRDGMLRRTDRKIFPYGLANIVAELEHGLSTPQQDVKNAVLARIRAHASDKQSTIPARAIEWKVKEVAGMDGGGTYKLARPDEYKTGDDAVDAVYARYAALFAGGGTTDGPVSRPLDFDPQYDSIFHGGRR